jgi:TP901 family phage tail tape measure protein
VAADLGTGFINVLPRTFAFGPQLIAKTKPALDALEKATGLTFSAAEVAGVAAFAGLSAASIKLAKDFETAMSRVEGLVGLTHDETEQLSKDVLNLATQVPVGPQELAEALYFIESAGLRGQNALDALTVSAKAAASGLGSTKEVADVVTSAMNSYAQSGLTAGQATDILIAAVREGKTDPATFAKNIGQVLPVAAQLGITFDQVAAAIASSTREGLQAGRAATGIRYLLGAMIRPSQQAQEALAGVGISMEDLDRSLRNQGLLPTLQTLSDRFDLSTASGRKLFATVVGGIRGMSTAAILVGENGEAVQQIFDNVANSAGSLNIAFEVASHNLGFQTAQLVSDLKVLGIEWGQRLLPIAKDFIGALKFVALGMRPIVAMAPQILAVTAAWYGFKKVQQVINAVRGAMASAATAMEAETVAAQGAAVASTEMGAASERLVLAQTGLETSATGSAVATTGLSAAQSRGAVILGGTTTATQGAAVANDELAASEALATTGAEAEAGAMTALTGAELEAGAASTGLGAKLATVGTGIKGMGAAILTNSGVFAEFIAFLLGAQREVASMVTSAGDVASEFRIPEDVSNQLQDAVDIWGGGIQGAIADPFALPGTKTKEAAEAYAEIAHAALDAGVSQDVVNEAYARALPLLNSNRASIDDFKNAFQGYIVGQQSVVLATDGWNTAQNRATANLVLGAHAWEAYKDIVDASPHGLRAGAQALDLNTESIKKNSEAYDNLNQTQQQLLDYGRQIERGYSIIGPLFDQMGLSMGDFRAQAAEALETGKWDDFASSVMGDAAQAIQDFHDTAVENLSFVDDQLSELGDHPTAAGIIDSFRDAGAQTKSFAGDLSEIRDILGGKGKSLAAYFLETGNAAAAAAIASASPEQQRQAVKLYNQQAGTVEKLANTLTSHLLPTLRDLRTLLEAIAGQYDVALNARDHATPVVTGVLGELQKLDGQTYFVDIYGRYHRPVMPGAGGDPGDSGPGVGNSAKGGIIHGATGFIARRPTYLVGEGLYPTSAGRGAEAVIPLGQRGMDILATAIKKGTGDSLIVAMLDALHQFNVQRDLVTEVGTKRAINIFADMERTLRRTGQLDLSEAYEVFRKSTTVTEANSWRGLQRDAFRDLAGRQVWGQGIRDLRGAVSSFATKKEADDLILQLKQHYRKTGEFGYRRVKDTLKGEVSDKEMHRILNRIHDQLDEQNKRERDRDRRPEPVRHLRLTKDSDAYVESKARKAVTGRLVDQRLGREMTRRSS